MTDYIKREDALEQFDYYDLDEYLTPAIRRILKDIPSADVAPVVRCKDCKWFGKIGCAIEVVDETDMPKENDFCSFAERKDND